MSIKGFLSNFWKKSIKIGDPVVGEFKDSQQYVSIAGQGEEIYGLRVTPKALGLVTLSVAIDAVDAANILSQYGLPITGHSFKKGDVIRMTSGALIGEEAQVVMASDPNWIGVVGLSASPALGDTVSHLRPITQTYDLSGNTYTTSAVKSVVDSLDTPLLETGTTTIPRSSVNAVQIVASLAADVTEMQFIHDIGEPTNLYLDAARTQFICHVSLTPDEKISCNIPAGSAIFIGAARDADIPAGSFLEINFIG